MDVVLVERRLQHTRDTWFDLTPASIAALDDLGFAAAGVPRVEHQDVSGGVWSVACFQLVDIKANGQLDLATYNDSTLFAVMLQHLRARIRTRRVDFTENIHGTPFQASPHQLQSNVI
mgnify:CR=1 FL=1